MSNADVFPLSMIDVGALIKAVEKCACLWDVSHEDYHNREERNIAWEAVSADVFKDWYSTDEEEKRKRADAIKKKWGNVRDCYRRDLNLCASGSKKGKKYLYTDRLTFLNPRMRCTRSKGRFDNADRRSSKARSKKDDNNSQDIIDNVTEELLNHVKRNTTNQGNSPTEILDIINERKPVLLDEDDNINFLLSFRSDMKRMNDSQKVDFKIGMLQLLKQIMDPPEITYSTQSRNSPQILYSADPGSPDSDSNVIDTKFNHNLI